jgi:hypothetical protein
MKEQRHDHKDIFGLLKASRPGQVITAEEFNECLKRTVIDESEALKVHTQLGNDPFRWEITARSLFAASQALKSERERVQSTLKPGPAPEIITTLWIDVMLTAFGIECLVKSIWILQGHQLARDGKYVGMPNKEKEKPHDLVKMCDTAGITLNQRETDALRRMSDIGKSIGRYPIGKSAVTQLRYWSSKDDDNLIEKFVARLKAQIRKMRYPNDSRNG